MEGSSQFTIKITAHADNLTLEWQETTKVLSKHLMCAKMKISVHLQMEKECTGTYKYKTRLQKIIQVVIYKAVVKLDF